MEVRKDGETVHVALTIRELKLLRHALERASFIDTPPGEQAAVATFCARALELLPRP